MRLPRVRPDPERPRTTDDLFDLEMRKVLVRLRAVVGSRRADFFDGSATYDHASLVILRLAAMLEDASPFKDRFATLDDESRRGIVSTRNMISHFGYATIDDDLFWHTITVDVPALLQRLDLDRR